MIFTLNWIYLLVVGAFFPVLLWSLYNLPILAVGVRSLLQVRQKQRKSEQKVEQPSFSIVVPVKNEEKVLGRLLEALGKLEYPQNKMEVIIVEDGSTDGSLEICRQYSNHNPQLNLKIFRRTCSDGKPSALNFGIDKASGEIVAVFDADSIPAIDVLSKAGSYFKDSDVAAVQGRTMPVNAGENMLTKFAAYEDLVWYEVYMRGKDVLNLFVHLRGSCQFIRRSVLVEVDGFDEHTLSEDMELSARLTKGECRIRYASDAVTQQESPASLAKLFRQRTRWYRGTMEVAFKYGTLMAKPNLRKIDAEATLFGPFILLISIATYFGALCSFFLPFDLGLLSQTIMQFTVVSTTLTFLACGLALVYASKPRKARNIFWLGFIFLYWLLQTFVATYAFLQILLRRPRKWVKTEKTGLIKPRDAI